jgi:dTDP-4-dehydrorhamnose reductase
VKLLVFGANGQIGRELSRAPRPPGFDLVPLDRTKADVTDEAAVAAAIAAERPGLVINLAAMIAVDRAESEIERAFSVNCDGAERIARACRRQGTPLIQLSTDYVFDGEKRAPYCEDDRVHPLGVYGASKEAAEARVRALLPEHVILRTAWVFSPFGGNFVKTILARARGGKPLRIVADQIGSPTPAAAIAAALFAVAVRIAEGRAVWGTFHFAGAPPTSWHGFAEAIVDLAAPRLGRCPELAAIATSDYPTPARRPLYSVLDCGKIAAAYALSQPSWRAGLAATIGELLDAEAGSAREAEERR